MRKAAKALWFTIILLLTAMPVSGAESAESGAVLVGRVSHVQGELLRYVPESEDWVAIIADAPFGLDDALYSGEDAKAEFIMPNRTRIRTDGTTQIQLITLKENLTEVDVASGMARFYNDSHNGVVKVTTPFGYAVGEAGTSFDVYVGDQSVEVVPLEGVVDFALEKEKTRYEATAGSFSLISNGIEVTQGEGTVDAEWHAWNEDRDKLWAKKMEVKGDSVRYLPEGIRDEAQTLDEEGRWEKVNYEGKDYDLWKPTRVESDWEPFTAGRWTEYHRDQTWVPDEPFGYVTHHYGNWVYLDQPGGWYWAPPVVGVPVVSAPFLNIGFSWFPGRVGWISSGVDIGWVPLAPFEVFYAHRFWGPRTVIVSNANFFFPINRFRFRNQAIIINRNNFFAVRNFRTARVIDVTRRTSIRNFRGVQAVNERVVRTIRNDPRRFQFTNTRVNRIPSRTVVNRITRNTQIARQATNVRAATVQQNLRSLRQANVTQNVNIQSPRVTNRLVDRAQAGRAPAQQNLQQRELKRQARPLEGADERRQRAGQIQQRRTQSLNAPSRVVPERTAPGRVAPERGQRVRPGRTESRRETVPSERQQLRRQTQREAPSRQFGQSGDQSLRQQQLQRERQGRTERIQRQRELRDRQLNRSQNRTDGGVGRQRLQQERRQGIQQERRQRLEPQSRQFDRRLERQQRGNPQRSFQQQGIDRGQQRQQLQQERRSRQQGLNRDLDNPRAFQQERRSRQQGSGRDLDRPGGFGSSGFERQRAQPRQERFRQQPQNRQQFRSFDQPRDSSRQRLQQSEPRQGRFQERQANRAERARESR